MKWYTRAIVGGSIMVSLALIYDSSNTDTERYRIGGNYDVRIPRMCLMKYNDSTIMHMKTNLYQEVLLEKIVCAYAQNIAIRDTVVK
jgi:hypothetical protein